MLPTQPLHKLQLQLLFKSCWLTLRRRDSSPCWLQLHSSYCSSVPSGWQITDQHLQIQQFSSPGAMTYWMLNICIHQAAYVLDCLHQISNGVTTKAHLAASDLPLSSGSRYWQCLHAARLASWHSLYIWVTPQWHKSAPRAWLQYGSCDILQCLLLHRLL